jgi:nucleoside 2-deoxyribosyltransferase
MKPSSDRCYEAAVLRHRDELDRDHHPATVQIIERKSVMTILPTRKLTSPCRVYLAGPFFNPEQVAVIAALETCLRGLGHSVFSPREGTKLGDGLGQTMAERKASAREIFDRNILEMDAAHIVLAVVDGSDAGTMWEIGYLYCYGSPIVTFTDRMKGLNIMIQECVVAHCFGVEQVRELFSGEQGFDAFQRFSPEMI